MKITQQEYEWKKCICKKTHTSGSNEFIENQDYLYKATLKEINKLYGTYGATYLNNEMVLSYSIMYNKSTDSDGNYYFSCYTYLPSEFADCFVDKADLRNNKINEIFKD